MAVPPPLPAAALPDKAALRASLRRGRAMFAAGAEGPAANRALVDRLLPLLDRGGAISGYVALRGEPDIADVLLRAREGGTTVALPHVGGDRRMHFARWHPHAILTAGALGIPQPDAGDEEVVPAIVLTPLVGFDRAGHRLGQGAGYYDRWFAAHPEAMRVGIAWSMQEVPALPHDPWDMPLHAVVTEKEWIRP
jgi:5-formyltetrahydrofolate cyclo-ligase